MIEGLELDLGKKKGARNQLFLAGYQLFLAGKLSVFIKFSKEKIKSRRFGAVAYKTRRSLAKKGLFLC